MHERTAVRKVRKAKIFVIEYKIVQQHQKREAQKVKELAQAVVETVGDMKFSELINNVEGQMLRDFFYVAKSITTAEESK